LFARTLMRFLNCCHRSLRMSSDRRMNSDWVVALLYESVFSSWNILASSSFRLRSSSEPPILGMSALDHRSQRRTLSLPPRGLRQASFASAPRTTPFDSVQSGPSG
jgi:hypothetical protein